MFSHEKLIVYRKSITFVAWTQPIIEELPGKVSARDQLERASTSVPLNIAEGNGKFSIADRARFWQIAHGSAVECAGCLDVLVARKKIAEEVAVAGKEQLEEIVNMLLALLDRLGCRVQEEPPAYGDKIGGQGSIEED
ncbi:MAG TPA: four helix bundle protein [Chthoniobacteraceae bacterium]|jgi:four helix bundle protein|nr:four helix bundle protein [Chthoniobacteraceae bacterium]